MAIRGRKPKAGTSRDKYLRVRMTPDELDRTERVAETLSLERSEYVRQTLAADAKRKKIT
jgi:hypothetical protein